MIFGTSFPQGSSYRMSRKTAQSGLHMPDDSVSCMLPYTCSFIARVVALVLALALVRAVQVPMPQLPALPARLVERGVVAVKPGIREEAHARPMDPMTMAS